LITDNRLIDVKNLLLRAKVYDILFVVNLRLKTLLKAALLVLLLIAVSLLAFFVGRSSSKNDSKTGNTYDYPLLAKRIFLENASQSTVNFSVLRSQLNNYFSQNHIKGGLYFEYLPTGTSIRIGGDKLYEAASLLKLPLAMDVYKMHEKGKLKLDKVVTLQEVWLDSAYGNLYKKGAGYKATIGELVEIMLKDSDNTALRALASSTEGLLDPSEQSFNSLDVELLPDKDYSVSVSPRAYASFLKCLYFACYLNNKDSQQILTYLSESKFKNRIVDGVRDKDVVVAHKTGNFEQDTQSDCGIVYLSKRNYILCAMIKGGDNPETDKIISKISNITYSFVSSIEVVKK